MTWWLKAAEELRTLRQLGIAKPGSATSGFLLEVPTATIEGTASEIKEVIADPPAAAALPPPSEPAAPSLPVAEHSRPANPPRSSFLRDGGRYKLHWEIRPQARKTASK
jgi:hypothetical protein